jgi:hemerythrin superfamily protein
MPRTDAIAMLKAEHDEVDGLFARYEELGDRALKGRQELVGQITRALSLHAYIEEQVFYPRVRRAGREIKDEVLEGLEEHHVIKELLSELEEMAPDEERYDAKVKVLKEQVQHHVEEEEGEMFPRVRKALDASTLLELAEEMRATRAQAPTHADPDAPDEPSRESVRARVSG